MGINTLRVGPLLCPDNVGILIFWRYFLEFCRVHLFLSFFYFFRKLSFGLIPKISIVFVDLHSCPLTVKERVSGLCPIKRSTKVTWLTLLNIPKSRYLSTIVNSWAISWGIATGLVANVQCRHPIWSELSLIAPFSTLILLVTRLSERRSLGHASLYRNGRGQQED